jgi:rhodanese-related sulfurtransferase
MTLDLRWTRRIAAGAFLCALLGCGASGTGSDDVSSSELLGRLENGDAPLVLDVRSPGEFAAGHVPGAMNISHDALAERLAELGDRPDAEVVVYCERGPRAAKAAALLAGAGFSAVRRLTGDMAGWRAAGLPVATP